MSWIFRVVLTVVAFALITGAGFLVALPKPILLDIALLRLGFFLTTERLREGIAGFEAEGVALFLGGRRVLILNRLSFSLGPLGPKLEGECGGGKVLLEGSWTGTVRLKSVGFTCADQISSLDADVKLNGGLSGFLRAEGVKTGVLRLDEVRLEFDGDKFSGRIRSEGVEMRGRGRIKLDYRDPLRTSIEGTFRGGGLTLFVKGDLRKINVYMR